MPHFYSAIHAFEGAITNRGIKQAVFHGRIILAESDGILGEGVDGASLVLLNERIQCRRVGGIKDMIAVAQKLYENPQHGVTGHEGFKIFGCQGLWFFFCRAGFLFLVESWLGDGVDSLVGSSPNIRARAWTLNGDRGRGLLELSAG